MTALYCTLHCQPLTKVQISALLQTEEKSFMFEWANVQKQPNDCEYGLVAIAFATVLCHGQRLDEQSFDTTKR